MKFEAVLFDLDDTLLDRNKGLAVFVEHFTAKYTSAMDNSSSQTIKELIFEVDRQGCRSREDMFSELSSRVRWISRPEIEEMISFWYETFPGCAQPAGNLYDVLSFLRKRKTKMGIVTNGESKFQNRKIDVLKVREYMDTVIVSEEAGIKKPDAKIFELALSQIGAENKRTLFVGDNPGADVKGALNAGLIPVWVSWGRVWSEEGFAPEYIIDDISELPGLIIHETMEGV